MTPTQPTHVIAIVRNGQKYLFHYTASRSQQAIYMAARMAGNPQLDFDWKDVARVVYEVGRGAC